jgi:OOP family OmpA-OmpF porin
VTPSGIVDGRPHENPNVHQSGRAAAPSYTHAQGIIDRLKAKAEGRVDGQIDAALEKALDQIENATKCVVGDDECVAEAKKSGTKVVLTDDSGKILPPEKQSKDSPARNADAVAAANAKNAEAKAEPADVTPEKAATPATPKPAVVWANYDFIPGERVLFADDFSGDRVGNFPQRLELSRGNMEIVDIGGKRFLRASSLSRFWINLPEALPQRFTFEFAFSMPWNGMMVYGGPDGPAGGEPLDESGLTHSFVKISGPEVGVAGGTGAVSTVDPRGVTGVEDINGHMFRLRVHGDGKYLKVYLDEHRVANIPNANFNRTNRIVFEMWAAGDVAGEPQQTTLIGDIPINAGGRDMYDALVADGRVVTQGILFDVGSDRIRPESTPTMKIISDMLKAHADLKLTVEGHTDNVGNAAANQTLSEKRAQAIVAYLTTTFAIDRVRLQSKGFGASKPSKPNETPEGRQQNRRVELAKI